MVRLCHGFLLPQFDKNKVKAPIVNRLETLKVSAIELREADHCC